MLSLVYTEKPLSEIARVFLLEESSKDYSRAIFCETKRNGFHRSEYILLHSLGLGDTIVSTNYGDKESRATISPTVAVNIVKSTYIYYFLQWSPLVHATLSR